ncbi:MAG: hypothetical protein PHW88_07225 [Bacteroidales bacterium]|jgi:hypothetical protein|nr:hypothetical protein [Bacteroidales bacterium]MDD2771660.1 hypothetical protein [Bacteroidales bacterium]MDD3105858.1 hypothetical protein [Bacteroidales bacterium]MDD3550229.1 hypothetical protein [Bacteroidales bacterium]MDD4499173.1 hypothetical protein [Bacteroidales bacterium]
MKTIHCIKRGIYPVIVVIGITIALLVMAFTKDYSMANSTKFANEKLSSETFQEIVAEDQNV